MTTTTMMMMTMMMMPPPLAAATYPATCAVWPCMRCCLHRARPCESPFFWWRLRCMNSLTRLSVVGSWRAQVIPLLLPCMFFSGFFISEDMVRVSTQIGGCGIRAAASHHVLAWHPGVALRLSQF
jgi:hypothetical protein